MENYMAEVAKMLGVELGEEFEVDLGSNILTMTAMLTDNGLKVNQTNMISPTQYSSSCILEWLLCGLSTIKHKPWKPKEDDLFYIVGYDGKIIDRYWEECTAYKTYYRIGNCYRTREDAESNKDKWISFYASDEVLEV